MNNTALQIYALFILLILSVGCKDDWKNLNLRSGENEPFYWENNKLAAQRLAKIMYNKQIVEVMNVLRSSIFRILIYPLGLRAIITSYL